MVEGPGKLLLAITLFLVLLASYFVWPLHDSLVLGIVFAYVGRPVKDLFGKRRRIGSLAAVVCIVVPLSVVFAAGIFEAASQLQWLQSHRAGIASTGQEIIARIHIPQFIFDEISRGMDSMMKVVLSLLTTVPVFDLGTTLTLGFLNLLIAFCVCYYLLADGERLVRVAISFLNLEERRFELQCLARIDAILGVIYSGSIFTAIIGGVASIVIFYLFSVPRPLAMASIVFLAGVVPFLTLLIFLPVATVIYFEAGTVAAIIFFAAASVLVHFTELIVRPYIVYARYSIHPLLVMLSFLGGGLVGGVSGFFIAPAMVGVITGIYQVIKEEQEEKNWKRLAEEIYHPSLL